MMEDFNQNYDSIMSEFRSNVISWYPFKENSNILEINEASSKVSDELRKNGSNLEIIDDISQFDNKEKKYDYIVILGLEKYEKKYKDVIHFAKKHINKEGTILFSCTNKYGLKNFVTDCRIEEDKFDGLSKNEIKKCLSELKISDYKFYYLLPDYRNVSVIFTDEYLPNKENIQRDFNLYSKDDVKAFKDERETYKKIIAEDEKLFEFFSNSYLVEISSQHQPIHFVSFNNYRKANYRLKTIMMDDVVCKQAVNESGQIHIEQVKKNIDILNNLDIKILDRYEDNSIYSQIIEEDKSLDKIIIDYISDNKTEEAVSLIDKFVEYIKNKLLIEKAGEISVFKKYNLDIPQEIDENLHYAKYGFLDLIFQNCFYFNDQFYFYDQEWLEENLPIEFIIYRAIEYLGNTFKIFDKNTFLEKYELKEFIEYFEKLEKCILHEIRDEDIWNIHAINNMTIKTLNDTGIHYRNLKALADQDIEKRREEVIGKDKQIQELMEENHKLRSELEIIKNSKSWKMTKPLREVIKKIRK